MIKPLVFFILLIAFRIHANEACYSFYPDRLKANINHDSSTIQIFRSKGFVIKLLNLSELSQETRELKQATDYLNSQYLKALNRDEPIKEKIKNSNANLWSQMHLLLIFDNQNLEKPVAGGAYITSKSPEEKLAFEDEFKIDYLRILNTDFSPVAEIGRLSVDSNYSNRGKALDTLLESIYNIHIASTDYKKVFIYSTKRLLQLYDYKGFTFEEVTQLSTQNLIDENDTIAIFKRKK